MTIRERATTSIPRLGGKIGMVHLCDAQYDEDGILTNFVKPGEGETQIELQIELLQGMAYKGHLMFEWPKAWVSSLAQPEVILPDVAAYFNECVNREHKPLTAYKGDKNAARFVASVS